MADPPTGLGLRPYARETAVRAGIPPDLFIAQIQQESGFDPAAFNAGSGATGIAQIIRRFHPNVDPTDPIASLDYAADWMAQLWRQYGSYRKALAAYNWGPGNVAGWDGKRGTLPAETRHYLDVILGTGWPEPTAILSQSPTVIPFDPSTPPIRQDDPWSCGPTSARWAMMALGRKPSEQWFEDTMLAEKVVSRQDGLLNATGAGLAAFIRRHYGEFGYDANHEPSISFDWAAAEGGHAYPVLIGGRGWNHWAVLTGYDPANRTLQLMNPSPGWMGIGDSINRANFDALGPWSAVRIWHPDLLNATPPPPPPPADDRNARALALLKQAVAILEE